MTKLTLLVLVLAAIIAASNVFAVNGDFDSLLKNILRQSEESQREESDVDSNSNSNTVSEEEKAGPSTVAEDSFSLQSGNPFDSPSHNDNSRIVFSDKISGTEPLKCYSCTDCPTVHANTSTKFCQFPLYQNAPKPKCIVYAYDDADLKKYVYIRGCSSDMDSCETLDQKSNTNDAVSLVFCQECSGSLCNTSGAFNVKISLALLSILLIPTVFKHLL